MFASFFGTPTPSTPFDVCPAFETIRPLISSLFVKEAQLKNADVEGSDSDQKYKVISGLCTGIRELQDNFNQASKESHADTANQLIAIFANKLKTIIHNMWVNGEVAILSRHRDIKKRAVGQTVIDVGTHATMVAAGAAIGPGMGVAMVVGSVTGATAVITTPIRRVVYHATGLTRKKIPKSRELFDSLDTEIRRMSRDFKLAADHIVEEIDKELANKNSAVRPGSC
jgi:hypothetical protein